MILMDIGDQHHVGLGPIELALRPRIDPNDLLSDLHFRDYRYAQGVLVPFYSELRVGDKVVEEVQVGTITFAQKVDEAMFQAG